MYIISPSGGHRVEIQANELHKHQIVLRNYASHTQVSSHIRLNPNVK